MIFRIGQKVVCVDDSVVVGLWDGGFNVKKGAVYTVRGIEPPCECLGASYGGLFLCEVVDVPESTCCGVREPSYRAYRFRPIVERKTDISIFKKLLTSAQRKRELVVVDEGSSA